MITYKPAHISINSIFIKKDKSKYRNKIIFNGVIETYALKYNLLIFTFNI